MPEIYWSCAFWHWSWEALFSLWYLAQSFGLLDLWAFFRAFFFLWHRRLVSVFIHGWLKHWEAVFECTCFFIESLIACCVICQTSCTWVSVVAFTVSLKEKGARSCLSPSRFPLSQRKISHLTLGKAWLWYQLWLEYCHGHSLWAGAHTSGQGFVGWWGIGQECSGLLCWSPLFVEGYGHLSCWWSFHFQLLYFGSQWW